MQDHTKIEHRDKLLADICEALDALAPSTRLGDLGVTFHGGADGPMSMGLVGALSSLTHDLYWDERGSWADATSAVVEPV
jgi:hypothetical protein